MCTDFKWQMTNFTRKTVFFFFPENFMPFWVTLCTMFILSTTLHCSWGPEHISRSLVQAAFRKGRGTRDQIANIRWIIEKASEVQKNIYFRFIDYAKAFDCVDHNKLWKILKEMGIPDHLICLLRNLYAGQEATVRTWKNRLVPNRKRSSSRLYIVTLFI